ncbi:MAG TPA: M56 family metallopeptidase [Phenylobacterium sp.]|nr:M56 family metallopeptidase [Phenylobacterium sp.]
MMSDLFDSFVRANLFGGLAVAGVLALRLPARRFLGPHNAYALWLAVPLAFLASFLPGVEAETAAQAAAPLTAALPPAISTAELAAVWTAGAALAAAAVAIGQMRFLARARAGRAGPAVVGVICPRLVTPADFQDNFTAAERALIRAHERAHIDRNDPKVNAAVTAAQALCWFNPLAHVGAHFARLDQELACDATVMATRSRDRRLYAETMLKTQMASSPLPLGCHWLAGRHPLEVRIGLLKRPAVPHLRRLAGAWGAAGLALATGYAAWAAQPPAPPRPHFVQSLYTLDPAEPRTSVMMIRLSPEEAAALPRPARR